MFVWTLVICRTPDGERRAGMPSVGDIAIRDFMSMVPHNWGPDDKRALPSLAMPSGYVKYGSRKDGGRRCERPAMYDPGQGLALGPNLVPRTLLTSIALIRGDPILLETVERVVLDINMYF
jgi:hypothetical protein